MCVQFPDNRQHDHSEILNVRSAQMRHGKQNKTRRYYEMLRRRKQWMLTWKKAAKLNRQRGKIKWLDRQADRERATESLCKRRGRLSSRAHEGVEGGQRLNGMEKRCDWLITVMEHSPATIGLLTRPHPAPPSLHTILYAPRFHELQWCVCVCVYEKVHTDTADVKHLCVKLLLRVR